MATGARRDRPGIVRDSDAGSYLERFLVCSILSMLAIRAYLRLTGYPQVGGRGLHWTWTWTYDPARIPALRDGKESRVIPVPVRHGSLI